MTWFWFGGLWHRLVDGDWFTECGVFIKPKYRLHRRIRLKQPDGEGSMCATCERSG